MNQYNITEHNRNEKINREAADWEKMFSVRVPVAKDVIENIQRTPAKC